MKTGRLLTVLLLAFLLLSIGQAALAEEGGEALALRFVCDETVAQVTVYDPAGLPVAVGADGVHHLTPGTYYYNAEAEGYESTGLQPFTIPADAVGDQELRISLTPAADDTQPVAVPGQTPLNPENPDALPGNENPEDDGKLRIRPVDGSLTLTVERETKAESAVPPMLQKLLEAKEKPLLTADGKPVEKKLYLKTPDAEELYLDRLAVEKELGYYTTDWTVLNLTDEEGARKKLVPADSWYDVTVSGPTTEKYQGYEPVFALLTLHWDEEGDVVDRDVQLLETTHTPTWSSWSFSTDTLSTLVIAIPTGQPVEEDTEKSDREKPAFAASSTVDGVTVTVSAPAGVFPADAALWVERVPLTEEIDAAVEAERDGTRTVAAKYTFDIRVINPETMEEYQPVEGQTVSVSFALAEVADENLQTQVYHVTEAESTGELSAEALEVSEEGLTATAETEGFSYYQVEFTYEKLEYVLPGDTSVPLSEILTELGLSGDVTEVVCSKPERFSADWTENRWIVTAHRAFNTQEWMKVTINSVVYEITVTDDQEDVEEYDLWVGNVQVTSKNKDIISIGVPSITGITGTVSYEGDASGGTLKLQKASIQGGHPRDPYDSTRVSNIYAGESIKNLTISVTGENTFPGYGGDSLLYSNVYVVNSLTIEGNGSLEAKGNSATSSNIIAHDLTISGTTVTTSDSETGLSSYNGITITNSTVNVKSSNIGIVCDNGSVTVEGSSNVKAEGTNCAVQVSVYNNSPTINIGSGLGITEPFAGVVKTSGHQTCIFESDRTTVATKAVIEPAWVITATADENYGTVTGSAAYQKGASNQQAVITATANEGCSFVNWTENGSVVSTDNPYTFPVTADRNLTATFEETVTTYPIWVGGEQVTENNCNKLSDNHWSYDPSTHTLTLSGYTYQGQGYVYSTDGRGAGIYYNGADDLTISLSGANHITPNGTNSGDCGIMSVGGGTLTFAGGGSLLIDSVGGFKYYGSAIYSSGTVVFSSGTFLVGNNDADYGVRVDAGSYVVIEGGVSSFEAKGYMAAVNGPVRNAVPGTGYDAYKTIAGRVQISSAGASLTYTSGLQTKNYQIATFPMGEYTVVFNPGDGSGNMDPMYINEGEKLKLPACTLTPPKDDNGNDKAFNWWEVSGADGIYYVDSEVLIPNNCAWDGVVTVTAKWKAKTEASILVDAAGQELDYTGSPQDLLSQNGVAFGGTMAYAFGEDGVTAPTDGWDTAPLSKTDAGTYYIWYKVVGDSEHFDSAAKCTTATINQASGLTVSLTGSTYIYDGTARAITNTPTTNALSGSTSYSYSFEESGSYVPDLSSLTKMEAGAYTVYVKATNPNYSNVADTTATLTILPPATAEIKATKTLEGRAWADNDSFTFNLTPVTEKAPMPENTQATATKDAPTANFGTAEYFKVGTWEYTITETNGGLDGVSYDTASHTVLVTVTQDDPTKAPTAAVTYDGANSLTVTNTFTPVKATLQATKAINTWRENDSFTFNLAAVTQGAPMPASTQGTATEAEPTVIFGEITYETAGTFEYTITEQDGGLTGVTYDTTPHSVTVTVTKADDATNAMTAAVTYDGADSLTVTNSRPFHEVVIDSSITGGLVDASPASAAAGDTVTLTVTTDAGSELTSLTVTNQGTGAVIDLVQDPNDPNLYRFVMPAAGVGVSASFEAIAYKVTEGADVSWLKGSKDDVSIVVKRSPKDTSFEHFRKGGSVAIDGSVLSEDSSALIQKDYRAEEGSTVITLHKKLLNRLSAGKHTVTISFDDGAVSTGLTILVPPGGYSPGTGDSSRLGFWAAAMVLAGLGFAGADYGRRRLRRPRYIGKH